MPWTHKQRKEKREERRRFGLCRTCGKPTVPGRTRCHACRTAEKKATVYLKARLKVKKVPVDLVFYDMMYRLNWRTKKKNIGQVSVADLLSLWASSKHRCAYCTAPLSLQVNAISKVQWDHVIPVSRGGLNIKSNLAPACRACNSQKETLTGEEFRLALTGLFVPCYGWFRAVVHTLAA